MQKQKLLKIIRSDTTFCLPDWYWRNDGGQRFDVTLWLVLAGRGNLRYAAGESSINRGDCFVFRHAQSHLAVHDPENPLTVAWATFRVLNSRGRPISPSRTDLPAFYRYLENTDFMLNLMSRSQHAWENLQIAEAHHWLAAALMEIRAIDARPPLSAPQQAQAQLIHDMAEAIRREPGRPFSLEALAEQAECSEDHLIRLFKKYRGVTPGEFAIRCRIQAAEHLLRVTRHSITQIAEMLGYADVYSFSRQFRQRTGRPPSSLRSQGLRI